MVGPVGVDWSVALPLALGNLFQEGALDEAADGVANRLGEVVACGFCSIVARITGVVAVAELGGEVGVMVMTMMVGNSGSPGAPAKAPGTGLSTPRRRLSIRYCRAAA